MPAAIAQKSKAAFAALCRAELLGGANSLQRPFRPTGRRTSCIVAIHFPLTDVGYLRDVTKGQPASRWSHYASESFIHLFEQRWVSSSSTRRDGTPVPPPAAAAAMVTDDGPSDGC